MSIDIARAWKDAQYAESLSSEERAQLPQNPVGSVELTDSALATVNGALCHIDPFCCGGLWPVDPIPGFRRSGGSFYGGGYGLVGGGYGFVGSGYGYLGGFDGGCCHC
ncbi:mersacidin/lichenicidin family type 2 lantibiotic [Dictyobacter aurantiacus]|uniref:Mersacidin/lichenicidin family type 2 lantibiotic n=1 Tax=Dictyobacter aurantiacus TaxID=1936993 RepID=A0A401ZMB6_9CHLR|nr:mersacidin/lichenicidin family type 2 lantibiotic [Dictyobacter aurantiacus]GCE07982.1 hypothetical protein KDAU_53110 [Dictyobacter aurantiacus]